MQRSLDSCEFRAALAELGLALTKIENNPLNLGWRPEQCLLRYFNVTHKRPQS